MEYLLNTHTQTVHKRRGAETTLCGSLTHVPRARTRVVSPADLTPADAIDRCGNCFEDAGGY